MTTRSFAPPPSTSRIAVVDANASSRSTLRRHLDREGYRVVELEKGRHLLRQEGKRVDVVCLDRELEDEDIDGVDVMRRLHLQHPEIPVIMVTADPALEAAVEAMKAGAYDCLARPVEPERFVQAVRRACQLSALHRQVRTLSGQFPAVRLSQLIGDSAGMREVGRQIDRVRDSDVTVCVFGASGTGKELVAREVHDRGHRKSGPFVAINCAAIPSSLQESELFGHEKGAFTGATNLRQGRFEQADGGTLFLDELGEMSPATQASLLRTLQEKTIRRVGGAKDIKVDVRIVCATHRDLKAEVAAGRFREDLYFRLMVFPIELPSLAERKEDIPALVAHFMRELRGDIPHPVSGVSSDALDAMMAYGWPGNVRELRNVVHRAMLATSQQEVGVGDLPSEVRRILLPSLPPSISMAPPGMSVGPPGGDVMILHDDDDLVIPLKELEEREIRKALRVTEGSVGEAAKLLGIGRATLYRRIAKMDLPEFSES
ncbi:MAG: sigma-54 dependent transcriptional regulator [Polyangiaceae bacterium]